MRQNAGLYDPSKPTTTSMREKGTDKYENAHSGHDRVLENART